MKKIYEQLDQVKRQRAGVNKVKNLRRVVTECCANCIWYTVTLGKDDQRCDLKGGPVWGGHLTGSFDRLATLCDQYQESDKPGAPYVKRGEDAKG